MVANLFWNGPEAVLLQFCNGYGRGWIGSEAALELCCDGSGVVLYWFWSGPKQFQSSCEWRIGSGRVLEGFGDVLGDSGVALAWVRGGPGVVPNRLWRGPVVVRCVSWVIPKRLCSDCAMVLMVLQ